ncbi:hypothetical protein [uncultured Ferrimonas sp.]|uniref:hypothetical protein n=1 Tax=uncultured Ferrimonas sp. TaxID=432640 RepID=UPI002612A720|nr:hypothetical protein [uncultured Ferrimonas sp.]
MQSFAFQHTLCGKNIDTKLFTCHGSYAGGQVDTHTTTTEKNGRTEVNTERFETVNVRMDNGKVRSVVKDGTANIPSASNISLFYCEKGDSYYPYAFYVHDTEKLHYLGKREVKRTRKALLNRGFFGTLWSWLMDLVSYAVGAGAAFFAATFIANYFYLGEGVYYGLMAVLFLVFSHLASMLTTRIGGNRRITGPLENALQQATFTQAERNEAQLGQSNHPGAANGSDSGGSIGGVSGIGPDASSNNDVDEQGFKPMM